VTGVAASIKVQVQWTSGTWTDITSQCDSLIVGHGAAVQSNPDRPLIASATGQLVTIGLTVTLAQKAQRFPIRVRCDTHDMWTGWLQEPRELPAAIVSHIWKLQGLLGERLETIRAINQPAETLATLFANSDLWTELIGYTPVVSNAVLTRMLKTYSFNRSVGEYVSTLAQVNTLEIVERLDGALRFVSAIPAALPSRRNLSSSTIRMTTNLDIRDRADRIRNLITTIIPATSNTNIINRTVAFRDIPVRVVSSVRQEPSLWRITLQASLGTELTLTTDLGGSWSDDATVSIAAQNLIMYFADGSTVGTLDLTSWTATGSLTTTGRLSVTLTAPPGRGGNIRRTADTRIQNQANAYALLTITARITHTITTPATTQTVSNQTSITLWGERSLRMADWLDATTDLQAAVDTLSDLRQEYVVRLPLSQLTVTSRDFVATIDAGDYVRFRVGDIYRDITIDVYCVVTYRRVSWSQHLGAYVALTLLEISVQTPPTPPVANNTVTLDGVTVTLGGQTVTLGATI